MKTIGTPAFRQTKDCIGNSFPSSDPKPLRCTESDSSRQRDVLQQKDTFSDERTDPPIGCVIMASGEGKRFGENKLMASFRGKPMIQWILDATDGIFSQRIVVTRHPEVHALCGSQGIPSLLHDLPYRSDTIRLGLEAMDPTLVGCFFCPGDQPLLTKETVAALALCAKNNCHSIWRTAYEKEPGSPVYFPARYFAELRQLPPGQGGSALIQKYPEQVSYHFVEDPLELADIDTKEMLAHLSDLCQTDNQ